jgi:hypothetical protein
MRTTSNHIWQDSCRLRPKPVPIADPLQPVSFDRIRRNPTVWLTGNLWLSVGVHAGAVLAEDLIFSVPDSGAIYTGHLLVSRLTGPAWLSGGDAGPEGSVLALPVFSIMLVLLWIVYRRRPARTT